MPTATATASILRRVAIAGAATAACAAFGSLTAAAPASAAPAKCAKPANVIASKYGGYVYRRGASLWACTAFYGDPPKVRRLGPWSAGFSTVNFDGSTAVWTVAGPAVEGVPTARIWAADAPAGKAWLRGVRPTTTGVAVDDSDNVVVTLKATGQAAAWVTGSGAVMLAVQSPSSPDAFPIGDPSPAAHPAAIDGLTQGLATPLATAGRRLFVGRWTNVTPAALGATIALSAGDGDGDECGGASDWKLTVTPLAGQPAVGARRSSDWTSSSNSCQGL